MSDEGKRIDYLGGPWHVGRPIDIGWGMAVLNADNTITRWCKSCGVTITTRVMAMGRVGYVEEGAVYHRSTCRVLLGNNAVRS